VKRGGPLQRKTPLRSSAPSLRDTKPKAKPGAHVGVNEARRLVKARSDGFCEIRMLGCFGQALDWHHRKLRSQGGKWEAVNGLHACRYCHEAVTNTRGHRAEYEANGWLVKRDGDPASTEVLMWHDNRQDWWLLKEDGTAVLAPWPKGDLRHPDDIEVRVDRGLDGVA